MDIKSEITNINWGEMFAPLENKLLMALLVAFFLPWVSFGPISISGMSIPGAVSDLGALVGGFNKGDKPFTLHYYLLFLIPLSSIAGAWFRYKKDEQKAKLFTLAAAGVFLIAFIGALIGVGTKLFNGMSFGGLISLIVSIAIFVIVFELHTKFTKK